MENRIDRKDDESSYQPKIHSERIKTLYGLKHETGKPMTVLLDQAIHDLAANYGVNYQFEKEPRWTGRARNLGGDSGIHTTIRQSGLFRGFG